MKNEVNRTLVVKKNKKIFLIAIACLLATAVWSQTNSFSAAEIVAGTTKGAVTANVNTFAVKQRAQICKTGSQSTKVDVVEGNSSASGVDEKYVQIQSTAQISRLYLHATYNASGSGKKMVFAYWGEGVTPAIDNVLSAELVTFPGYDGSCDANYVDVTPPAGARTVRIYRQLKNFDGTGYKKGTNWGDNTTFFIVDIDVTAGPAPASTDATLSDLQVGGVTIDGFSSSVTNYTYTIPATATSMPSVTATKHDSKASDPVITQASMPSVGNPTQATVVVTAEDGTTTQTYTITFTRAELSHDATLSAIMVDGTAISGFVPATKDYTVSIPYSQTTIPVVSATVNFAAATHVVTQATSVTGSASILVTAEDGTTQDTYTITFQKAAPSTDATLKSLSYNGTAIPSFSSTQTTYTVQLQSGSALPVLAGETTHAFATIAYQQISSLSGNATATVTAEDGTTTKTYTVTFKEVTGPPIPATNLTLHVPETYEAEEIAGGYDGTLSVHNEREYEVYYGSYMDGDALSITVTPGQKQAGITTSISKTSFKAADGWFEGKAVGGKSNYTFTNLDEFKAGSGALHKLGNGDEYVFHIQGYDQFSLMGKDNNADPSKGRHLEVYVDNILQTMSLSTSHTIRRFDISTGEHIIKVKAIHDGDSKSEISGFSLRVSQEPRTKWLKGNDSTQTVMQTTAIQPVVYTTKYNNIPGAETRLLWLGSEATGISLTKKAGSISDTLTLGGIANCPTGKYNYAVVAYYNGAEKNRVLGKFYVKSDIKSVTSTNATVYQNEEMDQIEFKYYALSAENVILTWTGTTPAGITGNGNNGTYLIGGTPTQTGEYAYSITVQGADTIITGKITVRELDYGTNPVLYLYKNENAYESDGVRNYLKNNGWNPIERKAKKDGLRPDDQYAVYKLVVISEDVDANNPEVQRIIQENGAKQPVLNLKGFTYAKGEGLLGWGDPSNGAIDSTKNSKTKGTKIKIQHADHPIFQNISNIKEGDEIAILSNYALQGVMPIAIDMQYITDQTLCMGTAPIRKNTLNGYYDEGEWVAAIHEILPSARGGKKYICLPLARNVTLTTTGERLIKGIVDYLVSPTPTTITAPDLLITGFSVKDSKNNEYAATIDQTEHTITLRLTPEEYQALDSLKEAKPIITHPNYTSVDPASGEEVKLTYAYLRPQKYIITDFINKNVYDFILELYNPQQGIEEVYEAGQWVNIYDIYGRKVSTTNEDIYTMELPHGMYIIMTESGKTMKIMK